MRPCPATVAGEAGSSAALEQPPHLEGRRRGRVVRRRELVVRVDGGVHQGPGNRPLSPALDRRGHAVAEVADLPVSRVAPGRDLQANARSNSSRQFEARRYPEIVHRPSCSPTEDISSFEGTLLSGRSREDPTKYVAAGRTRFYGKIIGGLGNSVRYGCLMRDVRDRWSCRILLKVELWSLKFSKQVISEFTILLLE